MNVFFYKKEDEENFICTAGKNTGDQNWRNSYGVLFV